MSSYIAELEDVPFNLDEIGDKKPVPKRFIKSSEAVRLYIEQLTVSSEVSIDFSKPFRMFIRSADSVFKQASIYKSENDLEKAFVLFMKFCNLMLRELPKHKECDLYSNDATFRKLKTKCKEVLLFLERCKKDLITKRENLLVQQELFEEEQRELLKKKQELEALKSQKDVEKRKLESDWRIRHQKIQKLNENLRSTVSSESLTAINNDNNVPSINLDENQNLIADEIAAQVNSIQTDAISINERLKAVRDRLADTEAELLVPPSLPTQTSKCN